MGQATKLNLQGRRIRSSQIARRPGANNRGAFRLIYEQKLVTVASQYELIINKLQTKTSTTTTVLLLVRSRTASLRLNPVWVWVCPGSVTRALFPPTSLKQNKKTWKLKIKNRSVDEK